MLEEAGIEDQFFVPASIPACEGFCLLFIKFSCYEKKYQPNLRSPRPSNSFPQFLHVHPPKKA